MNEHNDENDALTMIDFIGNWNEILGNAENTNDDETQEEIAKVQSIVLQIIFLGDFTL